jgi:hypothetical protein
MLSADMDVIEPSLTYLSRIEARTARKACPKWDAHNATEALSSDREAIAICYNILTLSRAAADIRRSACVT